MRLYKFAVYGRLKEWLFDIEAFSEADAIRRARIREPNAEHAVLVCPGNDLGVRGL